VELSRVDADPHVGIITGHTKGIGPFLPVESYRSQPG
jgi:hypothetical protein